MLVNCYLSALQSQYVLLLPMFCLFVIACHAIFFFRASGHIMLPIKPRRAVSVCMVASSSLFPIYQFQMWVPMHAWRRSRLTSPPAIRQSSCHHRRVSTMLYVQPRSSWLLYVLFGLFFGPRELKENLTYSHTRN